MPHSLTPYLYSITSAVCSVLMQVFFKMLTQVLPQSIVLSRPFSSSASTPTFYFPTSITAQPITSTNQAISMVSYWKELYLSRKLTVVTRSISTMLIVTLLMFLVFRLLLKRLTTNCLGVCVMNMALQRIPLSIVNSLLNTGPIMIFFMEAYLYHKPLSKVHLTLTVISFIGVLIVVNPFDTLIKQAEQQFWSLPLPLISAVLASFGFIYFHQLKGKFNQFIMLEYTYITQVLVFHLLINFPAIDLLLLQKSVQASGYFQPSIMDPYCVGAFNISIILTYTANYCRVKSLFLLPPFKVVPLSYVGIVLSLLIDVVVFGHQTDQIQIFGILLTSVGLLSHLVLELIKYQEIKEKIGNQ